MLIGVNVDWKTFFDLDFLVLLWRRQESRSVALARFESAIDRSSHILTSTMATTEQRHSNATALLF
jgi:hypothetical protein